jgi:hypothetical protein
MTRIDWACHSDLDKVISYAKSGFVQFRSFHFWGGPNVAFSCTRVLQAINTVYCTTAPSNGMLLMTLTTIS